MYMNDQSPRGGAKLESSNAVGLEEATTADELSHHRISVLTTLTTWRRFRGIVATRGMTTSGVLGNLVERWVAEQDGQR